MALSSKNAAKLKAVANRYNRHPAGSGKGGQFAPKQGSSQYRASNTPGKLDQGDFLGEKEYESFIRANYFDGAGRKIGSSREKPAELPDIPIGAWKMDSWDSLYGRMIEQLAEFSPDDLARMVLSEDMVSRNEEGRSDDADRYAGWMKEGKQAPPVTILQMDDGRLKVSDGHRRVAAAIRAGMPVRAWVSYAVPNGQTDYAGKPMMTALTKELAEQQGFDSAKALRDAKATTRAKAKD